jgi:cytochrome o ubiquinol oxidase subunit 3
MSQKSVGYPGLNLGRSHGADDEIAEKDIFGFWVFLMSDLIIFGLMFATYVTMQTPAGYASGPEPKDVLDLGSAFVQTMLLLVSSLTIGFAALALRHKDNPTRVCGWLLLTLLLGLGFLAMEFHDFQQMFANNAGPDRSGFLSAFFGLVPLHGLHVGVGCLWIVFMIVQIQVFGTPRVVKLRLLRLGLFWHFLDIVWIGIFSIVYLGGLA